MGREIRRVPAGWEHPKESKPNWITQQMQEQFKPLYDNDAQSAWNEWNANFQEWLEGGHETEMRDNPGHIWTGQPYTDFCGWDGGPPNCDFYRPRWSEAEQTHYQMYETVSEGTPVSPVFATLDELAEYLILNGDYWDQKRGSGGWGREAAEAFCKLGYASSMMVHHTATGTVIAEPRDAAMYGHAGQGTRPACGTGDDAR